MLKYFNAVSNDGYYNKKTGFRSFLLTFDDGAKLEIMNHPEQQDFVKNIRQTGYIHIAFSVGSKEKVNELTEMLKNNIYLHCYMVNHHYNHL